MNRTGFSVKDPDGHTHWIKSFGPWGVWLAEKFTAGAKLPGQIKDRFDLFIVENAPPIPTGKVHLHAHYDSKGGKVYWKVIKGSNLVCKIPGRCKIMELNEPIKRLPLPTTIYENPVVETIRPTKPEHIITVDDLTRAFVAEAPVDLEAIRRQVRSAVPMW